MRAALHLPSPIPTLWTVVVFLPAIENQFLVSPIVSQPKIKFLSSCPTGAGIFLFVSLVRTFFYFFFFSLLFLTQNASAQLVRALLKNLAQVVIISILSFW